MKMKKNSCTRTYWSYDLIYGRPDGKCCSSGQRSGDRH